MIYGAWRDLARHALFTLSDNLLQQGGCGYVSEFVQEEIWHR